MTGSPQIGEVPSGSVQADGNLGSKTMTLDQAIAEWKTKRRRMGCVAAADWFCKRVPGFRPERLTRYTKNGELYQHVVITDGIIRIDVSPYADKPRSGME